MAIHKSNIGAHGKHTVYAICYEIYETGGTCAKHGELARFDSLETATNVLRYIRGDAQSREQIADAVRAIREIDRKEGV